MLYLFNAIDIAPHVFSNRDPAADEIGAGRSRVESQEASRPIASSSSSASGSMALTSGAVQRTDFGLCVVEVSWQ
jgi:hypothetical protein